MKKVILDKKMLEEARNTLIRHRKMIAKKLPKGWELTTLFAPIQYERTVTIRKKKYIGYLRSRWEYPFSIEIYEKGRKFKLGKLIFSHKPVDMDHNNPPLRSMRIVDRQFKKMRKTSYLFKLYRDAP